MKNIIYTFVTVLIVATFAYSQPVPVAYYPFNGNANDAGSNGINGTLFGNPVLTTDNLGNANSAYEFDGINDYINLGSSVLLKPDSQVTLALWAYAANWASFNNWAALAGNTASGGYELIIHGSSATLEAECKRNGAYAIADYPLSNISNGWHHLAFTYDGRYTILYIDGIAVDTDDAGAIYPIQYGYPGNSTIIGDEAGTGNTPEGDPFTGKIDEVRFYDVALSAQEILSLYNASAGVMQQNQQISKILYPNPSSGTVNIQMPNEHGTYLLTIYDFSQKIISQNQVICTNNIISFNKPMSVKTGLYFINISNATGQSDTFKVVYK